MFTCLDAVDAGMHFLTVCFVPQHSLLIQGFDLGDDPCFSYLELVDSLCWQELKLDVGKINVGTIRSTIHEEQYLPILSDDSVVELAQTHPQLHCSDPSPLVGVIMDREYCFLSS